MSVNTDLQKVKELVKKFPLAEALSTAEVLISILPIPGLSLIAKILRILVFAQPIASKAMGVKGNIPPSQENAAADTAEARRVFKELFALSLTDDVITDAEKAFLHDRAIAAGYAEEEFELMVINKHII